MSRRFFDQIDDELRGLVGPDFRRFKSQRTGRLIKVWFAVPAIHFEAQLISQRWAPGRKPLMEIGLHLESPSSRANQTILDELEADRSKWRRKLFRAEAGEAYGPQSATWRRLSEVLDAEDTGDPDFGGEVAERLAVYIKTLHPLLAPKSDTRGPAPRES